MFIYINKEFKNPFFNGGESNLYIRGDYLYKIYKGIQSSFSHLMNLIERQKNIKKTILPDSILYKEAIIENKCEYSLLGCRIKYFNNSIPLGNVTFPLDKKITILEELIECLKELLDNYIYPNDLHILNILIDDQVRIIDLDTLNTKITNFEDRESYIFVLQLLRNVLLNTIYGDYSNRSCSLKKYLEQKNLSQSLINDMTKECFDFEDANNLIYSLKDKKQI